MLTLKKYRNDKKIKRKPKANTAMNITEMYNFLQQSFAFMAPKHIIFDIRSKQQYDQSHILTSINLDCTPLSSNNTDNESIKFKDLRCSNLMKDSQLENKKVIIYHDSQINTNNKDDNDEEKKSNDNDQNETRINQVIDKLSTILNNAAIISSFNIMDATFSDFKSKYPFLCVATKDDDDNRILNDYPNEIIDEKLFLGDANHAKDWQMMEDLKISHIVNATDLVPNHFEDHESVKIEYLKIPISDQHGVNIKDYFAESIKFIDDAFTANKGNRVFVHCQMGVSRSSTIIIAYLMFKNKWRYDDAIEYAKKRRPCVCPNQHFTEQLEGYEKKLFDKEEEDSDSIIDKSLWKEV